MHAKSRQILQQRDEEAQRAQREAVRQRKLYWAGQQRQKPLTHRPFAHLPEVVFRGGR